MSRSPVVSVTECSPGVALITMEDRAHKNTFSDALIEGLLQAFAEIASHNRYRAVVLTGYDTYFASGGTQEGLLSLQEGKGRFSDVQLYSLSLDCDIPVIAAMQGHGIGGGFVFGLFADIVILGRESVYTANFMKYGFTPGMGSTLIVPQRLGSALATEVLLSARSFRGEELARRGVPFAVLPRAQVLSHAQELARELAEKPRIALVTLKAHLTRELRARLPVIIEQELQMHEITFHQAEVRDRIQHLFGC